MSLKIICSGYLIRCPLGGLSWHHLQYLAGLKQLDCEVTFVEHFGWKNSCYDTGRRTQSADPSAGITRLQAMLDYIGLDIDWCYLSEDGKAYGMSRRKLSDLCSACDLCINLSNVNWIPEFEQCVRRVLIDTDPVFTQVGIHGVSQEFERYDRCFTFGENVHLAGCQMPTSGTHWIPTRQPIVLDYWKPRNARPAESKFTTITSWTPFRNEAAEASQFGQKNRQFDALIDLPMKTKMLLELAADLPAVVREKYITKGWSIVHPHHVADNLQMYQHYLRNSCGEFSVAKHGYVTTQCGWFSERSGCYLASGVPVVVEDTGFSKWLPTGKGVLAFNTEQQAIAGLESVMRDYYAHSVAAREIATQYFDSRTVLTSLLETSMESCVKN